MDPEEPLDALAVPQQTAMNASVESLQLDKNSTVPRIVSTGIIRLSAIYKEEPSEIIDVVWAEALADIAPAKLVELFRKLENTFMPTSACPFPTPAHLRALYEEERTLELAKDAELAWQVLTHVIVKWYHPNAEGGWYRGAPKLPPRTVKAAEAAGGIPYLWACTNAQLVWAKKEFIAAYGRETT